MLVWLMVFVGVDKKVCFVVLDETIVAIIVVVRHGKLYLKYDLTFMIYRDIKPRCLQFTIWDQLIRSMYEPIF